MRCGNAVQAWRQRVRSAAMPAASTHTRLRHQAAASSQVVASLRHAIVIGRLDTSVHRANKHHPAARRHPLYLYRDACTTFHTCPTTAAPAGTAARTPAPAGSECESVKTGWGGCGKTCKRTQGAGSGGGGSRRECGTYPALLGLGQLRPHICILLLNTLGRQRGARLRLLFLWRGGRPLLFVGHDRTDV